MPTNRRGFLGHGRRRACSFVSLGGSMPGLFARAAEASAQADGNDHVLVVVELAGGNDGLNTVVPFEDALYYKNRRRLGLPKKEVLEALRPGRPAPADGPDGRAVQGGASWRSSRGSAIPNPTARTSARWRSGTPPASSRSRRPTGWLGRCLDATEPDGGRRPPRGLALDRLAPAGVPGRRGWSCRSSISSTPSTRRPRRTPPAPAPSATDAPAPDARRAARLPPPPVRGGLPDRRPAQAGHRGVQVERRVSRRRAGRAAPAGRPDHRRPDLGVRVLFASQDGYDTHADQADDPRQPARRALRGARRLPQGPGRAEAGRPGGGDGLQRVRPPGRRERQRRDRPRRGLEPLPGRPQVKGGLVGKYPSLAELGEGDLVYNTDFRSVYATLLDRWLGCPAEKALGRDYPRLDLIKAGS